MSDWFFSGKYYEFCEKLQNLMFSHITSILRHCPTWETTKKNIKIKDAFKVMKAGILNMYLTVYKNLGTLSKLCIWFNQQISIWCMNMD